MGVRDILRDKGRYYSISWPNSHGIFQGPFFIGYFSFLGRALPKSEQPGQGRNGTATGQLVLFQHLATGTRFGVYLRIFVHLEEETCMKIQSPRRQFLAQSGGALLAAAVKPARAAQPAKPPAGTLSEAFLARLPEMMELANVPGLSLALIKDGKLVWARGFGNREANKPTPVDADTIFPAASLSKPVFTYAVLKLREEKLIDLDRPLVSYLNATDLPDDPRTKQITARHCLTHSTGWQNWRFSKGNTLQFAFTPGEKWQYSGEGFFLLQRVVEQITGKGFEDAMRERVLNPLGMKRSSYIRQPEHDANFAAGHNSRGFPSEFSDPQQRQKLQDLAKEWNKPLASWRYEEQLRAVQEVQPDLPPFPNFLSPNSAGSLITTAPEYANFMIRLLDKPPADAHSLSEATRREMLTPQVKINRAIAWGLGLGLQTEGGRTCFWHWGDNGNWKTFMFGDPAARSGVAVFTNGTNGHKLWQRIVAQATGHDQAALLFWMV
jgi:CubicO group peptidase (beta-lactamase class C family)